MLDINSTFFVQILNFLVLLLVLKKFAWGPLLATLHARTEKIENNIRMADEDRAQAAEMKKEYEAKLPATEFRYWLEPQLRAFS